MLRVTVVCTLGFFLVFANCVQAQETRKTSVKILSVDKEGGKIRSLSVQLIGDKKNSDPVKIPMDGVKLRDKNGKEIEGDPGTPIIGRTAELSRSGGKVVEVKLLD